MSIFTPGHNYKIKYSKLNPQIYELAIKNKYISKEKINFLKNGKYIIDTIVDNLNTLYIENFLKSSIFKDFSNTLFISCYAYTPLIHHLTKSQLVKYNLNFDINSNEFIGAKSSISKKYIFTGFSVINITKNVDTASINKFSSNYEGFLLLSLIVVQYILEVIDRVCEFESFISVNLGPCSIKESDFYRIDFLSVLNLKRISVELEDYFTKRYPLTKIDRDYE